MPAAQSHGQFITGAHRNEVLPWRDAHAGLSVLVVLGLLLSMVAMGSSTSAYADLRADDRVGTTETVITSSGNQESGRWQAFPFEVTEQRLITVHADWVGDGDVNIFWKPEGGKSVAWANSTTAKPEYLEYLAPPGSYELAVLVKTGEAAYTVEVTGATYTGPPSDGVSSPAEPAPPTDGDVPTTLTSWGSQESGRWQVFPFEVTEQRLITVHADWVGDGDVNIFWKPEGGKSVAWANSTTAKPEYLEYLAPPGAYELAVLVKTGEAAYTVDVTGATYTGPPLSPAPEPSPDPAAPQYPGQPAAGTTYWGSYAGGNTNANPEERYGEAGARMGIRRTFFQWRHRAGSYVARIIEADHENGRLPWVSFKTPSWAAMGDGAHDDEIDELLVALARHDGPVWLTIHHEPEGGGGVNAPDDPAGPAGHVAMNRRVRERMTALDVENVALAPIFMRYSWDAASGRDIDQWWEPGIYDFLGIDTYSGQPRSLVTDSWLRVRAWAEERGVDVAVGEWGMDGTDEAAGERVREWFLHAADSHDDGQGARVVGLAAFDSDALYPGDRYWTLRGHQLAVFKELTFHPQAARLE
jgi:hypothetical protein